MGLIIGFDLGGTNSKVSWLKDKTHHSEEESNNLSVADEDKIIEFVSTHIDNIKGQQTLDCVGIALACSVIPSKDGRRISPVITKKFSKLTENEAHHGVISKIEEQWGEALRTKVVILNDGEAAAVDVIDQLRKLGKTYKNVLVVTLGTSIGVGFVFDGSPYIGAYSSRASHIILDPGGDLCSGENHKGCWKTIADNEFRKRLASNKGLEGDDAAIAAAANAGSIQAKDYFATYAANVARGITIIINAIPVECVVVAGGVAKAGDLLIDPLKARISKGDWLDPDIASYVEVIAIPEFSVADGARLFAEQQC